jgi:hypothetical protein
MFSRRIFAAGAVLCAIAFPAHAQKTKAQLNTEIGTNFPDNTTGQITPQNLRTITGDIVNSILPTAPVGSGHVAVFSGTTGLLADGGAISAPNTATVCPASSTNAVCNYTGDGVSDQNAIASAIGAVGTTNSRVVLLPGVYTFSGALTISAANNFTLDAAATVVFGPTGTADAFIINGSSHSTFNFDTIVTNSTGSAIHVKGAAAAVTDTFINWGTLSGTSHQGNGLFFDATTGPMSVNYAAGGQIGGFNKGVVMDATGTTNFIDTTHVKAGFIFDCNTDIYGRSGTGTKNNSNIWDVNVDPYINGAIAVDIDHSFDRFDPIIWGDQAPNTATTLLLKLEVGAAGNQFNGTPNIIQLFGASLISDLSGTTTNTINNATIDATVNGAGQIVKFDANALQVRSGLSFGTIGTVNTLPWFSATGVLSSLATANNGVLVTSAGGVPSWATTLPAGLTIPTPIISSPALSGTVSGNGTIPSAVLNPTLPSVCFIISTSATTCNNGGSAANNGTYTTPTGAKYIRVRMVGAGAGGAGGGSGSPGTGVAGGNTTFGSALLTANGGAIQAGAGGTASGGYSNLSGGAGGAGVLPGTLGIGGPGGISGCGFSSSSFGVLNGQPTAPGGFGNGGAAGGSNTSTNPGAGGSAGGCLTAQITSPSATYSYAVGAAGTSGAAGTNGQAGAAGTSGAIEVIAYYQ